MEKVRSLPGRMAFILHDNASPHTTKPPLILLASRFVTSNIFYRPCLLLILIFFYHNIHFFAAKFMKTKRKSKHAPSEDTFFTTEVSKTSLKKQPNVITLKYSIDVFNKIALHFIGCVSDCACTKIEMWVDQFTDKLKNIDLLIARLFAIINKNRYWAHVLCVNKPFPTTGNLDHRSILVFWGDRDTARGF